MDCIFSAVAEQLREYVCTCVFVYALCITKHIYDESFLFRR